MNNATKEKKKRIVRATVDCISKYGYNKFSMQDVAKAAGVSKGIIHYYFSCKEELMRSVLETVAYDLEENLKKEIAVEDEPNEKLRMFIKTCVNLVRTTKDFYQIKMDFWTQINQNKEVRNIIAGHYQKIRGTGADVIRDGIREGSFRAVDADKFSAIIIAIVDGISLQWLFEHNCFDLESIVDQVIDMVFKALQPYSFKV